MSFAKIQRLEMCDVIGMFKDVDKSRTERLSNTKAFYTFFNVRLETLTYAHFQKGLNLFGNECNTKLNSTLELLFKSLDKRQFISITFWQVVN